MTTIIERKKGRPGAKHFKTEVKHARQKGYTIIVAMGEFLDYPILNATSIDIIIKYKPLSNKILQIQITDNTQTGFQNLKEDNDKNPFNYGYNSSSHDDDESISEFGAGLKEAFIALSDKITIYTRSDGEYYKIVFNIEKMSNIIDANESYNYDEKIISQSEYIEEHKLSCGSSIILEEMVDGIIINEKDIKEAIIKTYGKIIKKRKIVVKLNGEQLIDDSISPFDNEYCKPFNTITKLYAKKNDSNNEEYHMEVITKSKTKYYQYDDDSKEWSEINKITEINKLKAYKNWYPECLIECKQIEEIMTITGTETQFCKTKLLTMGEVFLYKRGRQHGSYFCKSRNGIFNSVYLELEIYSKKIGKELGMTINKLIKLNKENKLCNVVIETINFMQKEHGYDSSRATAEKKYNIIKKTGLDITHVTLPTKLREKETDNVAAEKALTEKTQVEKTPVEKIPVEKIPVEKIPVEKTPAEKTPTEKTPAEKTPAEKTPAEKTPVKKVEVEEKKALAEKTVIKKVATERPPIKETEIEEKKALAEKTVIKKVEAEAEKVTTERPLIKKTEVEKTIAERIKAKAEELPLSTIVHSYRKKSVEVKKFKEVINTYINKFKDNEIISDEDLKIYNNICNMLNISP
jgi:hypothetical protein